MLASESCAFDLIQAQFVRDVEPGEVVIIDNSGMRSEFPFRETRSAFCIFEYVYFARPDSNIAGVNVSDVRVRMGRELARLHPAEADLVVPVPDSGIFAASASPRSSASRITRPLCATTILVARSSSRLKASATSMSA